MERRNLRYRSRHMFLLARNRTEANLIPRRQPLVEHIMMRHGMVPEWESHSGWEHVESVPPLHTMESLFPLMFRPAFVEPTTEEIYEQGWTLDPSLRAAPLEKESVNIVEVNQAQDQPLQTFFLSEQHLAKSEEAAPMPKTDEEKWQKQAAVPSQIPSPDRLGEHLNMPVVNREQDHIAQAEEETDGDKSEHGVVEAEIRTSPEVVDTGSLSSLQLEPKQTSSYEQPVEVRRAKRPRGRIEEVRSQDQSQQPPISPRSSKIGNQRANSFKKMDDSPVEQTSVEEISADKLFMPREDKDRSPEAWLARLRGDLSIGEDIGANSIQAYTASPEATEAEMGQVQDPPQQPLVVPVATESLPLKYDDNQFPLLDAGTGLANTRGQSIPISSQAEVRTVGADLTPALTSTSRVDTPLSQQTRRFLQPLVGIDLSNIRVYRDTIAERLTDANQADAVTMGNNVEMAAGHMDNTPETLGLLAHEFTHVARRREPTFIPPVVRSRTSQSSSMSEEELALRVEGHVRYFAQEQITPLSAELINAESPGIGPVPPLQTTRPLLVSTPQHTEERDEVQDKDGPQRRGESDSYWGGLPAPWEPLPDWLGGTDSAPISSIKEELNAHRGKGQTQGLSLQSLTLDVGMQRAAIERDVGRQVSSPLSEPALDAPKNPEPDLDALAQQVYSRLKRRLGVESRRES